MWLEDSRLNRVRLEDKKKWRNAAILASTWYWQLIIAVQAYFTFLICTHFLVFHNMDMNPVILALTYICDAFYIFDVLCAMIHRSDHSVKKMRVDLPRSVPVLMIDVIAMIPFDVFYRTYLLSPSRYATAASMQNRCLRVYKIMEFITRVESTPTAGIEYMTLFTIKTLSITGFFSHVMACFWFSYSNTEHFAWSEVYMFLLSLHSYVGPNVLVITHGETWMALVAIWGGTILLYRIWYPGAISYYLDYFKQFNTDFMNLEIVLQNFVNSTNIQNRLVTHFRHLWHQSYGIPREIYSLPLSLRKEIYTDMYWNAFAHSELLRDLSLPCKRSLALKFNSYFYEKGDTIYQPGSKTNKMIYLVEGKFEIMASENINSPLITFTSGTIMGEASLFNPTSSTSLVQCSSFCHLHVIHAADVARIFLDYPQDSQNVHQKLKTRYLLGRYTHWRKKNLVVKMDFDNLTGLEDTMKWVKYQWRGLMEMHQRYLALMKAEMEGTNAGTWRRQHEVKIVIEHMANYLDLLVLSDGAVESSDVACFRQTCPCSLNPDFSFVKAWRLFIMYVSVFITIVYPLLTAWLYQYLHLLPAISYAVTSLFIVDVCIITLTAIKRKSLVLTGFLETFRIRLSHITYYLDIIAAIPVQFLIPIDELEKYGIVIEIALIKIHTMWSVQGPQQASQSFKRVIIERGMILMLSVYWMAHLVQIFVYRCVVSCPDLIWITKAQNSSIASLLFTAKLSLNAGLHSLIPTTLELYIPAIIVIIFSFFMILLYMAEIATKYILMSSNAVNCNVSYSQAERYLSVKKVNPVVQRRLLQAFEFEWDYDHGCSIMSGTNFLKSLPFFLKRQLFAESIYDTMRMCPLFLNESQEVLDAVSKNATIYPLPAETVIISFGIVTDVTYIVHKGYVQMTSFLNKDISLGLGSPILLSRGFMIPVFSTLAAMPPVSTAVAITDCEVIEISTERLLHVMTKFHIFKDVIEVSKQLKLQTRLAESTFALVPLHRKFKRQVDARDQYETPFTNLGCYGKLLKAIFLKTPLQLDGHFMKLWEPFFIFYLVVVCCIWPMTFGVFVFESHIVTPVLMASYIIVLINLYVKLHVTYYNENGIIISHPLCTSVNHLTHGFAPEMVLTVPVTVIYIYLIKDQDMPFNSALLGFLSLLNAFSLIPVYGYMKYVGKKLEMRSFSIVPLIFICGILIHTYASVFGFLSYNWKVKGNVYLERELTSKGVLTRMIGNSTSLTMENTYAMAFYMVVGTLTTNEDYFVPLETHEQVLLCCNYFVGTLAILSWYAWTSSATYIASTEMTIFYHSLQTFMEFLKVKHAEDSTVTRVKTHFVHIWSRSNTEHVFEILQRLPRHLVLDLTCSMYKDSLRLVRCLADANEGFYRILSACLIPVYTVKGTIIVNKGEARNYLYFIREGRCFVYDWFITLAKGSIIGDIGRTGIMRNTIYSLTHVEILKVETETFFAILNGFHKTEQAYLAEVKNAESFIKSMSGSREKQARQQDSRDAMQAFGLKPLEQEQSYFEDVSIKTREVHDTVRSMKYIIYPDTAKLQSLILFYSLIAYFTCVFVPLCFVLGPLSTFAYIVIHSLDAMWVMKIMLTFLTATVDYVRGDVISSPKLIAKAYVKRYINGLFLDLVSTIPFEFVAIWIAKEPSDVSVMIVAILRALRLLRILFPYYCLKITGHRMWFDFAAKWFTMVFVQSAYINTLAIIYIWIIPTPEHLERRINVITEGDVENIARAYLYVANGLASSNLQTKAPETIELLYYQNVTLLLHVIFRSYLITKILAMIRPLFYGGAEFKYKNQKLKKYLQANDSSPAIVRRVLDYRANLMLRKYEETMPTFLEACPTSIRKIVMSDLFLIHLKACKEFETASHVFLVQLSTKFTHMLYFPGQQIVGKGDVDNTMYFIHDGEVLVTGFSNHGMEFAVYLLVANESFGIPQGVWKALPHQFTYRARTYVEILCLHSRSWADLRLAYPTTFQEIQARAMPEKQESEIQF